MMQREPNYLYLTIVQVATIVMVTSSAPLSPACVAGIVIAACSLMVAAWLLTRRRRELLFVALLGAFALVPLATFSVRRRAIVPGTANRVYVVNMVLWILFTLYVGLMVFRGILRARRVRSNEIFGAIYVYLLIGVLFAQANQLLLAGQPGALHFETGRFGGPEEIGDGLRIRGPGDVLYYSFVTLGTVGYGDVTPATPLARSFSLIEAIVGIMYVATMISRFVSIQISADRAGGTER
jgi:hypothetical protein